MAMTQDVEAAGLQATPYTTFSKVSKRWIVLIVAFAGMFSPLSSFIYYPAINALASGLQTSVESINLSITSYMIVSGILPSILGNAADQIGRRPVYVVAFVVYFIANVGLAIQNSFPALLVLRMIQSAGSSGTIALGYGVIADIAPPSERGLYVGIVLCGPNVAPSLGPVIGGVLADRAGWRWIFWFLCIMSGLCLFIICLFLPETARSVVGNGSTPATGINQDLVSKYRSRRSEKESPGILPEKKKFKMFNPIACLSVMFYKDNATIFLANGIFYMTYCCIQASLSSSFISIYHYQELEAGLIYLPFGFGCLMASYAAGRLLNRDYRIVAKKNDFCGDRGNGDDSLDFPIEKARLRSVWVSLIVSVVAIAGYGWTLQAKTHVAAPLALQFIVGATTTTMFNVLGTLLVDLNRDRPSTVSAGSNLVRCVLSASGLAALQEIINAVGVGWCFTIFAAIAATTAPLLLMERQWGPAWRAKRQREEPTAERRSSDRTLRDLADGDKQGG